VFVAVVFVVMPRFSCSNRNIQKSWHINGTASGSTAACADDLYINERIRARRRNSRKVATEPNDIFG
jgi:hypothetical protein